LLSNSNLHEFFFQIFFKVSMLKKLLQSELFPESLFFSKVCPSQGLAL